MPRPLYFHHPSSLEHDTGSHPENAARIPAIERELESRGWLGFERVLAHSLVPSSDAASATTLQRSKEARAARR